MRNHDNGIAVFFIDRFDQFQDFLGCLIVQRSGRLIAEQDIRVLDDSSSDRGSLLLTTGLLIRQFVAVLVKSECM